MASLVRRGTKGLIRDINNSRVLQIIQAHEPISRADIAKLAELPPPTVTSIVNDFIRVGLVLETDLVRETLDGATSLGRRPIMLTLNPEAAFTVGVKLRLDGLTVAITNLAGELLYHVDRHLRGNEPREILEHIAIDVRGALRQAGVEDSKTLGLGIGMPGLIDHAAGVCRYSPLLGWSDVDVADNLEALLSMPVYVDNDVNMLTAAEISYGAGREVSEFLTVTIGRGIGLGIVMRGEVYRGAFGGAGEFGHTRTESGLRCECGSIGCLEAVASDTAICGQVAAALGIPTVGIEEAIALGTAGNRAVADIFERAGQALGRGIGNLLNLFNPQLVIVTGEGTRAGALLLDPMRRAIREVAFGLLGHDARIEVQTWGDEAWARGAASIVVHEMLRPPIYQSQTGGPLAYLLEHQTRRAAARR